MGGPATTYSVCWVQDEFTGVEEENKTWSHPKEEGETAGTAEVQAAATLLVSECRSCWPCYEGPLVLPALVKA
jgi:hypothetical protein